MLVVTTHVNVQNITYSWALNSNRCLLIAVAVESDRCIFRPLLNIYDRGFVLKAACAHSAAFTFIVNLHWHLNY